MKTPSDADASEAPAAPGDHTIVIVAISVLMEISPGATSREQDRTAFGKRFSKVRGFNPKLTE
jgi:hypothetical protein